MIHCGDYCNYRRGGLEILADVDRWFAGLPVGHIVCIAGNHDFALQERRFQFSNVEYLEDSGTTWEGLRLFGSPWCPDLSGFAFHGTEERLIESWNQIPAGVDFLLTHTPPRGVLDLPTAGSPELGCPFLREELERIRPQFHCFGHVHASAGEQHEHGTHFLNAAVVGGGQMELRRGPICLQVEAEG